MEKAEAKKLQPFYLRRFLIEAIEEHGGKLTERETDRYEVKHVPAVVRAYNKVHGNRRPVLEKYERITFDRTRIREPYDKPAADLVHPSHPLMASLIDLVLQEKQTSLHVGTVLIDPIDKGTTPRLMFLIDHGIREGDGYDAPGVPPHALHRDHAYRRGARWRACAVSELLDSDRS